MSALQKINNCIKIYDSKYYSKLCLINTSLVDISNVDVPKLPRTRPRLAAK